MGRGFGFVLICCLALPAGGWELTVAFTNDLHVAQAGLARLGPFLAGADLVLDAGDAWEDLYRLTGVSQASAMADQMGRLGYQAMVVGNHELYLGPALRRIISQAPFPVLAANLAGDLPVRRSVLYEVRGVRVLILGLLWEEYPWSLWPRLRLEDPLAAAAEVLAAAPPHDVLILLGHMDLDRAELIAAALPQCDLFVLGHDHLWLRSPVWVGEVPIVQAGHRAGAVGWVRLSPEGVDYELREVAPVPVSAPAPLWWVVLALALLWRW
ncbi:MAG: metallophosphoesterase [Candidatus Bipolaricaulaceae bacterium]